MLDLRRVLVIAAFALVACGSAAVPVASGPPGAGLYTVMRSASTPPVRTDAVRLRESAPRASLVPETHRVCAFHKGATC